jgi:hypothetical protein
LQAVCIAQQFFDAYLGNISPHQVAYGWLILVEQEAELLLRESFGADMVQNCREQVCFDFESASFGWRKTERIKDVALHDVRRLSDCVAFHGLLPPWIL